MFMFSKECLAKSHVDRLKSLEPVVQQLVMAADQLELQCEDALNLVRESIKKSDH